MPVEFTRDPGSLGYDDYKYWIRKEVLKFFVDHEGDSDFPSHLVPDIGDFETMIDAYDAAFNPYFNLIDLANAKNKLFSNAAEALSDKLQQIKYALPTIAPDPDILAQFNLASQIPNDRDLLMTVAENALSHWDDVSGEPMFAPIVGDFDALQTLYDDCVAKQDVYVDTEDQRQATQNAVLATREALHVVERQVFNWYRSRHPNGQDEWWTNSPWGKTSGGSQPEPGENPFPNPLTGLNAVFNELGHASVKADEQAGAVAYNFYVAKSYPGNPTPDRPFEATWKKVSQPSIMDTEHDPGMIKTYWACGVNEAGEEGKFCDPVSVKFQV